MKELSSIVSGFFIRGWDFKEKSIEGLLLYLILEVFEKAFSIFDNGFHFWTIEETLWFDSLSLKKTTLLLSVDEKFFFMKGVFILEIWFIYEWAVVKPCTLVSDFAPLL